MFNKHQSCSRDDFLHDVTEKYHISCFVFLTIKEMRKATKEYQNKNKIKCDYVHPSQIESLNRAQR